MPVNRSLLCMTRRYGTIRFYGLLKNRGRLKALALGNYKLGFGQGPGDWHRLWIRKNFLMSASEFLQGESGNTALRTRITIFLGTAVTVEILRF